MTAPRAVEIKIDDSFTGPVCDFGVGFLKFENDGREATPAGTGTFARLGKTSGIITAGHVIKHLPRGKVGLVRFPSIQPALQNFRLDMEHTDQIVTWNEKEGAAPDLGFLKIPDLDARDLEAKGSVFYNLERTRDFAVSEPNHLMIKAYAIVGVVAEWAEVTAAMQPKAKKKVVGGLFGTAKITKEFTEDGTDLVEVEIDFAAGPKVPASYEGVSGGVLWELYVELDASKKVVNVNKKMHGIAFRQSADHRLIVCNGTASIDSLVGDIKAKWPDNN
jgi:hypothetical protein